MEMEQDDGFRWLAGGSAALEWALEQEAQLLHSADVETATEAGSPVNLR